MAPIILKRSDFKSDAHLFLKLKSSVFIYPTDTIYGIGCDATNADLVKRIRDIKQRQDQPFSVLVPTKEWIISHCQIAFFAKEYLNKIPGPYTLLLDCSASVANNLNPNGSVLGVRMIDSWFQDIVRELGFPIVTTSANRTGNPFMTSIADIDKVVFDGVDFIIDDGELQCTPSTIIDLSGDEVRIIKR